MAFRAGQLLLIRKQPGSTHYIALVCGGIFAISIKSRNLGGLRQAGKHGVPKRSERQEAKKKFLRRDFQLSRESEDFS